MAYNGNTMYISITSVLSCRRTFYIILTVRITVGDIKLVKTAVPNCAHLLGHICYAWHGTHLLEVTFHA